MTEAKQSETIPRRGFPYVIGLTLISVGLAILLEQYLKTGWIVLVVVPISGLVLLAEGGKTRKLSLIIAGALISGLGLGGFLYLSPAVIAPLERKIGMVLLAFSLGWGLITLLTQVLFQKPTWWALVPGGIIASVGAGFLFGQLRVVDFVLFVVTGTGIVLLIWGVFRRLFGLIIPGSLLVAIGPGVYLPWGGDFGINALTKTGIMIAIFGFGWLLIILFSRVLTTRFVWWPLIPGGIFAMVGWGLYIGGDPGGAASFIANTGSISLIIFGLYLLLLRKGIHR